MIKDSNKLPSRNNRIMSKMDKHLFTPYQRRGFNSTLMSLRHRWGNILFISPMMSSLIPAISPAYTEWSAATYSIFLNSLSGILCVDIMSPTIESHFDANNSIVNDFSILYSCIISGRISPKASAPFFLFFPILNFIYLIPCHAIRLKPVNAGENIFLSVSACPLCMQHFQINSVTSPFPETRIPL